MGFNRYAAGAKVYNGGSNAATRGTVDPTGYVNRSLNQRASQRRSGLAKAATRRLDARQQLTKQIHHTKAGPKKKHLRERRLNSRIKDTAPGKQRRQLQRKSNRLDAQRQNQQQRQHQQTNKGNGPAKGLDASAPGLNKTPHYPVVHISPNGQLNLPWNFQGNMQAIDAQGKANEGLLGLQQQQQQYQSDWTRQMREADVSQGQNLDSIRNDAANRGMVTSSGYLNSRNQAVGDYNTFQSDMNTDKTNFQNSINSNRLNIRNQLADVLRAIGIQDTEDAADRAGDLGYGRDQSGAVGAGHSKKGGHKGGNKPGGKKNHLSEGERNRIRRRRRLTRQINHTKAGPKRRHLRERRLQTRLRDQPPGKVKQRMRHKEHHLEQQRKRHNSRTQARKRPGQHDRTRNRKPVRNAEHHKTAFRK